MLTNERTPMLTSPFRWLYHRFMTRFGYRLGYHRFNTTLYHDGPWQNDIWLR